MSLENKPELFKSEPRAKKHNSIDNSERENVLRDLFSQDPGVQGAYLDNEDHGAFWKKVRSLFDQALRAFRNPPEDSLSGWYVESLEKKGGRKWRFDYLARTNWVDDKDGLKLEFKRGQSIFEQPQFLQLYAKPGIITRKNLISYPEYLYENFGNKLATIASSNLPSKSTYLKFVCGTNYSSDPFFESLYKSAKGAGLGELKKLQYVSIDQYLKFVSQQVDFVDSSAFQDQLSEQLEKLFVSWDTKNQKFVVENFSKEDITLTGSVSLKGGKNGLNALVFENMAGNKIEALLRWKNNPCVLGPAWQISLKVSSR
jgi:hypothetical protein